MSNTNRQADANEIKAAIVSLKNALAALERALEKEL